MNSNFDTPGDPDKVDARLGPQQNPAASTNRRAAVSHAISGIDVNTAQPKARNRNSKTADESKQPDRVERIIVGVVLFVMAVVPLLTFLFSFGNVGDLGKSLGIDWRIAYLTGPAVDLTATGMIVAATWLSYRGMSESELWRVHALSIICALIMFALNCGPSIYVHRYQLAGFSAVGPFLLMAMGFVGPWLLRQLTDTRTAPAAAPKPAAPKKAAAEPAPAAATALEEVATATAAAMPADGSGNEPTPATASGNGKRDGATTTTDGSGRPSATDWAKLALPLWQRYSDKHSEAPTAPVLASLLRNAHPDLKIPGSPRSERNIRAAVEKLLEGGETEDDNAAGREPSHAEVSF